MAGEFFPLPCFFKKLVQVVIIVGGKGVFGMPHLLEDNISFFFTRLNVRCFLHCRFPSTRLRQCFLCKLSTVPSISWMSALIFYRRDAHPAWNRLPEINNIWKSRHHCPPHVSLKRHPSFRCGDNPQNETLKFVNKFPAQSRHAAFVKISNLPKFALDGWVIFDGHRRSLSINASWDTALTTPVSISRSRSSAKAMAVASSIS